MPSTRQEVGGQKAMRTQDSFCTAARFFSSVHFTPHCQVSETRAYPFQPSLHYHHHYSGLAFISDFTALRATELHRPCSLLSDTRLLLQIHAPLHPHPPSTLTTIADFTAHSPPHYFSKFHSPTACSPSSFRQRNQRHQTHLRPLRTIPNTDCRL